MNEFMLGCIAMASFTVGLFFLRFYRRTGERLFAWFAVAFFLEMINRSALAFLPHESEHRILAYMLRLLSYSLIMFAIWDKNRSSAPPAAPEQS